MGWHPETGWACSDPSHRHITEQMAWPDCDCIGCVFREIAQLLSVGLFSAWGEWPS